MLNDTDYNNLVGIINFAFINGMVKSADDAKILLSLQHKLNALISIKTEDLPLAEVEEIDDNG